MTTVARPDVTQRIGNTPLVELNSFSTPAIKMYAKLEWYNPFGSVKDRLHTGWSRTLREKVFCIKTRA